MECKDESTGQAVTSSSDVTETGALIMNGNQVMVEPGSTAAVVPPADTVIRQPQSAVTQAMSPSVESGPSEPAQPPTAIHATLPPVTSPDNWPPSQPCPPIDQLSYPLSSHVGQQVQPSGEAVTADAQVRTDVQSEHQHPEPVSTLSQNLQQNLIIAQPTADLQSSAPQQPAVHPPSTQQATQQPHQPAGETMTHHQLPAMTSAIPEAPVNAAETTPPAALQQQRDIASVGLQQIPDEVTSPAEIDLSTVDVYRPPVSETVVAEQPADVPAAESTMLQAGDVSQPAALTEAHQPETTITGRGADATQHLPDTFTDQQTVNVNTGFDDIPQNVQVEPAQQQRLSTESMPLSAAQSLPHSPDVAAVDLQQQLCPPAVGEVVVSTTQPSSDVEPRSAAEQHVQQAALPSEQPASCDVASLQLDSSHSTSPQAPPPAAAARVEQTQQEELIQVQQTTVDIVDKQPVVEVVDNKQVEMFVVEQPTVPSSSEQPLSNGVDSERHVSPGHVGENQQQEVLQVQQPTVDIVDDKQPQQEDVVKATPNDVISAGSDTDDAPEVISDSLSRDRDATNEHDHQHPSVSHHCFCRRHLSVVTISIVN